MNGEPRDVTAFVESLPPGALPDPRADAVAEMHESTRSHGERMRGAFPAVIAALMCVHATMAATRVAGSLWLLNRGYPEWTVGALMSLFAVAPIGLSLWAGRLADRHGLHRPLAIGAAMGLGGTLLVFAWLDVVPLVIAALATGGALSVAAVAIQHEAGPLQHRKVLRHGGLRNPRFRRQRRHRLFPFPAKPLEYCPPGRVGQRFEKHVRCVLRHDQ